MKVLKSFICVVCALTLSASAFAKVSPNDENRDENGKIVRGPYLANGLWDNWFIGADAGVNFFMNKQAGYSASKAALDKVTKDVTDIKNKEETLYMILYILYYTIL